MEASCTSDPGAARTIPNESSTVKPSMKEWREYLGLEYCSSLCSSGAGFAVRVPCCMILTLTKILLTERKTRS